MVTCAVLQGDGGSFYLTTNRPSSQVVISPLEGKQTQTVTLTAVYSAEENLFDYEVQGNSSFDIQVSTVTFRFCLRETLQPVTTLGIYRCVVSCSGFRNIDFSIILYMNVARMW